MTCGYPRMRAFINVNRASGYWPVSASSPDSDGAPAKVYEVVRIGICVAFWRNSVPPSRPLSDEAR
jgi:hypothetical protein